MVVVSWLLLVNCCLLFTNNQQQTTTNQQQVWQNNEQLIDRPNQSDEQINLAVEDDLSEVVVGKMIEHSQRPFAIGSCLKGRGYGYLKKILPGLNHVAQGMSYLV